MSRDSSLTPLRQYGEFELIDAMRRILGEPSGGELLTGISDDAAVYRIEKWGNEDHKLKHYRHPCRTGSHARGSQ